MIILDDATTKDDALRFNDMQIIRHYSELENKINKEKTNIELRKEKNTRKRKKSRFHKALKIGLMCTLGLINTSYNFTPENEKNIEKETKYERYFENNYETKTIPRLIFPDFDAVKKEFETKNIPVLMFHNIHRNENRYTMSPKNFKKYLEEIHRNDFYSVSLREYLQGDFSNVPLGKKPVLITFDDASTGQFIMKNDTTICENSAVGILNSFYEKNDFGFGGVFFVSFGTTNNFKLPFMQEEYASKKMKYLVEKGYDVQFHSKNHQDFTNTTRDEMFKQYILTESLFMYLLGQEKYEQIKIKAYAHPFGAIPRQDEVIDFLTEKYDAKFNAWGGASNHPLSTRFNIYAIPRIEINNETKNHILNNSNTYKVTEETAKYYKLLKTLEKDTINLEKQRIKSLPQHPHISRYEVLNKVQKSF